MWRLETYKQNRHAGGIFTSYDWYPINTDRSLLAILHWYLHNAAIQDFNAIRLRNTKTDEVWQEEQLWELGAGRAP